jgi:hypothetical protein
LHTYHIHQAETELLATTSKAVPLLQAVDKVCSPAALYFNPSGTQSVSLQQLPPEVPLTAGAAAHNRCAASQAAALASPAPAAPSNDSSNATNSQSSCPEAPLVAFIIPSKGRTTLNTTLHSLINQTCGAWKAVVVLDGADLSGDLLPVRDKRVQYLHMDKIGKANHGGRLRNIGIAASSEDWVAFVDDDDTVSPLYVEVLHQHIRDAPSTQVVIFRLLHWVGSILPQPGSTNFRESAVGISFAMHRQLFHFCSAVFEPAGNEDYVLLNKLRSSGASIIISPHVAYFVRSLPQPKVYNQQYERVDIH